ncbi:MAG TPA: CsbD family protein [Rhizomicrobium sp.]
MNPSLLVPFTLTQGGGNKQIRRHDTEARNHFIRIRNDTSRKPADATYVVHGEFFHSRGFAKPYWVAKWRNSFVALRIIALQPVWEYRMDKDRIDGSANEAKGSIKEAAGKLTGDTKLETEGKADKFKGKVQNAVGGAKDSVRDASRH